MKKIALGLLMFLAFSQSAFAAKALVNINNLESDGSGSVSVYYQVAIKQGANSGKYFTGAATLDLSGTLANIKTALRNAIKNDAQTLANVTLADSDLVAISDIL